MASSICESGRSPGGGHDNPLQYSHLETPWREEPGELQPIVSQSRTRLRQLTTHRQEAKCVETVSADSAPPPAPSFQPKTWAECGPLISVNITDPTLHYNLRCLNVVSSSSSCCFTFLSVMFSCLFAWWLLEYLMVKQLCREFIIFFP